MKRAAQQRAAEIMRREFDLFFGAMGQGRGICRLGQRCSAQSSESWTLIKTSERLEIKFWLQVCPDDYRSGALLNTTEDLPTTADI